MSRIKAQHSIGYNSPKGRTWRYAELQFQQEKQAKDEHHHRQEQLKHKRGDDGDHGDKR